MAYCKLGRPFSNLCRASCSAYCLLDRFRGLFLCMAEVARFNVDHVGSCSAASFPWSLWAWLSSRLLECQVPLCSCFVMKTRLLTRDPVEYLFSWCCSSSSSSSAAEPLGHLLQQKSANKCCQPWLQPSSHGNTCARGASRCRVFRLMALKAK